MQEATQQFVPVQAQRGEVSVGRAPALREDTSTARILNFAQEMNLNNIKNQRAEMYLEGQIEAAQNEGVAETRANRPWVETLFGGGARLSGAMDYMEKAKVLEYQDYLATNMQTLRTQRPEQFKISQVEAVRAFLTDDAETNKRIMNTFTLALPDIARSQAKEHTAFIQEQHIQSMSHAAHAGLTRFENVRALGVPEDTQRQYGELAGLLQRPPGMLESSYKGWLYSLLPVAAKQGNPIVADILQQKGMVTSIDDIVALDKAENAIIDYTTEQETMQFGVQLAMLDEVAANPEVTPMQMLQAIDTVYESLGDTGNKHFTSAIVRGLLKKHADTLEKDGQQKDYASYVELLFAGRAWDIPERERQTTFQLADAMLAETRDQAYQTGDWSEYDKQQRALMEGYKSSATVNNAMRDRITGTLSSPRITLDETGMPVVGVTVTSTLAELDRWHENAPEVINRHLTPDTAAFYTAYRIARRGNPSGSEAQWVQEADQVRLSGRKMVGTRASQEYTDTIVENILKNDRAARNSAEASAWYRNELRIVAENYGLMYDTAPEVAASAAANHMHQSFEVLGNTPFPKVDGKSIAERSGLPDPMRALQGYLRRGIPGGNPTAGWRGVSITLDGSRPAFRLQDPNQPDQLRTVRFADVYDWWAPLDENHQKGRATKQEAAALTKEVQKATRGIVAASTMGAGPNTKYVEQQERQRLAALSPREVIMEYDALIQDTTGEVQTTMQKVGKWLYDQRAEGLDAEDAPEDSPDFAGYWARVFGYHADRDNKQREQALRALEIMGD